MDNLKKYLAVLRKHYFWLLCALICIVSVTTWQMASNELQARYNENYRKIKSTFDQLNEFNGQSPNEKYKAGLDAERNKINSQVMDAWGEFSKVQKDKLVWPEKVAVVNQLAPNAEIPEAVRENFVTNVVKPNLQRIFEIVNIRRPKNQQADQGLVLPGMGGRDPKVEYIGIVDWPLSKREELEKRFKMDEIPSTVWCRTKMEDMWIYESLANIVVKINEGSTDSLNASIKRIEKLDLAQWAILDSQKNPGADLKLKKPDAGLNGPTPSTADDGFVRVPGAADSKLPPDLQLLDGRYIDENNRPVPAEAAFTSFIDPQTSEGKLFAERLQAPTAVSANGTPRTVKEPPFTEFREVFVDMQFLMDQRKIPDLMAACANSPLPIEIRQVLMHFYDVDTVKVMDPAQAAGQPVGLGGGVDAGAEIQAPGAGERAPYDATVQLRGIVYIYGQPQADKLGKGSAANPAHRKLGTPQKKVDEVPAMAPAEPQFN